MTYPLEIRQTILDAIAGGESLRRVCEREGMPDTATVMRWLEADAEFATKYARARENQADVLFESMGEIESSVESGDLRPDAARVILESRRWRAEKLKPKKYGNKIEATHEIGDTFTKLVVEVVKASG